MPCTPNTEVKKYLSTNDIAQMLSKHPSAVVRWILRGTLLSSGDRRKLQALRGPGGWLVTQEWLDSFLSDITADRMGQADSGQDNMIPTPVARRRSHDQAEKELARAGF
jgi:hypothetical protein